MTQAASAWRYAWASRVGSGHALTGQPCQDAAHVEVVVDVDGANVFVAVVADGAGSAAHAAAGAAIVVDAVARGVRAHLADGVVAALDRPLAVRIVEAARAELVAEAAVGGVDVAAFAATVVVAVVGVDAAAYFQVGDGVIVVDAAGGFEWVFWPQRGEYANTTAFVSDAAVADELMHVVRPGAVQDVAVLTDGLQHLVLDLRSKTASAPFFTTMLRPLRQATETGRLAPLCEELGAWLASPRVNARTDDDKTLVLASRAATTSATTSTTSTPTSASEPQT